METLFLIMCIFELIIQIYFIKKLKNEKNEKYWKDIQYNSLAIFLSNIIAIYYFINNALGLSDAIAIILLSAFSLFSNLIIFIIALIIKKRLKDNINEIKKPHISKTSIIFFVANIFIVLLLPSIIRTLITNTGGQLIITYLNNKYGEQNYEIANIYDKYTYSGMFDKYHSGYHYEIKCDAMKKTFIVTVDDHINYIENDYFIPVYFSEKYDLEYTLEYNTTFNELDDYFKELDTYIHEIIRTKYNTDDDNYNYNLYPLYLDYPDSYNNIDGVTYGENYYIIPPDYGKIPTIEEITSKLYIYYNNN